MIEKGTSPQIKRITQNFGFGLLGLMSSMTVVPILIVVIYIIQKGAPAISMEFLTGFPSDGMRGGGILPAIIGTLYLTFGTAVFSVPLGIGAAIYLSEYAPENRWTRVIRIAITNLAGIPSVVYGLFGLGIFVIFLKFGTSILAASLTLSIMTLPVIISTSEEAIRAVPNSFRVVSTSLGATRWQTIRRIVLPQSLPGILTGVILGLERAAGETAPILFTGAAFFLPRLPGSPLDATMALPYHLFVISTQVPGMPIKIQYGTALVLLFFVLIMNISCFSHSLQGESQTDVVGMNIIEVDHFSLSYSDGTESLKDITLSIPDNKITVMLGPAGGGKSTLMRAMNRLNDLADVTFVSGKITVDGLDVMDARTNVVELRRKVGMVFARPVPLPLTIRQNITYGFEVAGVQDKKKLDEVVEQTLRDAVLWDEVKDRLDDPGVAISGGQQQRLCLARVLALDPKVILLDEPTSGLDPISTAKIEDFLQELKKRYTIILAPHSVQQASRTADFAAFFLQGELIETAPDKDLFTRPKDKRTQDYVEGRFG